MSISGETKNRAKCPPPHTLTHTSPADMSLVYSATKCGACFSCTAVLCKILEKIHGASPQYTVGSFHHEFEMSGTCPIIKLETHIVTDIELVFIGKVLCTI